MQTAKHFASFKLCDSLNKFNDVIFYISSFKLIIERERGGERERERERNGCVYVYGFIVHFVLQISFIDKFNSLDVQLYLNTSNINNYAETFSKP